jgi:prevent-host-death family protein
VVDVTVTTMSSREFNQDTGRAKTAARSGPVIITDRGSPAHVLMTYEEYQKLTGGQESLVDLLSLPPDAPYVELDIERPRDLARSADLD